MSSSTGTKASALNFYDKDFNYIGYADKNSLTQDDTTGIKNFTLSIENIPANAIYMRAGYSTTSNNINHSLINGDITYGRFSIYQFKFNSLLNTNLSNKIEIIDIFYLSDQIIKKTDGLVYPYVSGYCTPFLKIDRAFPIYVKGYAMATSTSTKISVLTFYDKDLKFISWTDNSDGTQTDTTGIKNFIITIDKIPANAVYMRASRAANNSTWKLTNGIFTYERLIASKETEISQLQTNLVSATNRISELENPTDKTNAIAAMAEKYDILVGKRKACSKK